MLANLSALGIEHLIAIGGDDTLGYAAKLNELGVKIIAIPKTMDNTSVTLSTASASRLRSLAPVMLSNGSGLPSVRMNGSAFFASSGETPGLPRSIPHTRPRSAVSFPSTGSISTGSSNCCLRTSAFAEHHQSVVARVGAPSGRATRCVNTVSLTPTATERRQA